MSTPAHLGGYEWKALCTEARVVKADIRRMLSRFLEHPGDATLLMQVVLKLSDLDDLVSRLEEIGRNTKN
jgi:hypothetical protein